MPVWQRKEKVPWSAWHRCLAYRNLLQVLYGGATYRVRGIKQTTIVFRAKMWHAIAPNPDLYPGRTGGAVGNWASTRLLPATAPWVVRCAAPLGSIIDT
jgi:hypothetical protein